MKRHWLGSLIVLLVQIGFFVLGFHLLYPLTLKYQSSFSPRPEYLFAISIAIFIVTSSIQWLVTNILRGDFRYGIAVANFLLVTYGLFQQKQLVNSILVLSSALLGLLAGQVLYYQIFRAKRKTRYLHSNILDDEL